ncbi:MAG TPA: hypothetical protein PKH77_00520 [Anaerolineae bacterium]|nr:hypothetical protein [Anaerolineae bacterium]
MPENPEPKYQVGALESPDPADPGYVEWDAALMAAQALHDRINHSVIYPRAVAVWSWPDGECLAIIYSGDVFKPS